MAALQHATQESVDTELARLVEAARLIAARSRREQGLPPRVSDPAVIHRLATLVGTKDAKPS